MKTRRVESWSTGLFGKTFSESDSTITGCEIVKYNIQTNHIHMMIIPPKYAVSAGVGKMKGMTSSALRRNLGG